jgi:hypothetical protein
VAAGLSSALLSCTARALFARPRSSTISYPRLPTPIDSARAVISEASSSFASADPAEGSIDPVSGADMQRIVADAHALPANPIAKMR